MTTQGLALGVHEPHAIVKRHDDRRNVAEFQTFGSDS